MARARKRLPAPWTARAMKTIGARAGRHGAAVIGRKLKRREGAIRQKALTLGIGLRVR